MTSHFVYSSVFIFNLEQAANIGLVFLLLALNKVNASRAFILPTAFDDVVNEIYHLDNKCGHIQDEESHELELI